MNVKLPKVQVSPAMNSEHLNPRTPGGQILWITLIWFGLQSALGQVATSLTTKGDLTLGMAYVIETIIAFAILTWWISGKRFENVPFNYRYTSALFLGWLALASVIYGFASHYFGSPDLLKIADDFLATRSAIDADTAFQQKLIFIQFLITVVGTLAILLFCLYKGKRPPTASSTVQV